jgi:phosphoribosylglycinamide formyltransferase-1
VLTDDDDHTLSARILDQEHAAYTEAINLVLGENYRIQGRRVVLGGSDDSSRS